MIPLAGQEQRGEEIEETKRPKQAAGAGAGAGANSATHRVEMCRSLTARKNRETSRQ